MDPVIDGEEYQALRTTLINKVNYEALLFVAGRIRGKPCHLSHDQPAYGGSNIAFRLEFDDDQEWAAIFPYGDYTPGGLTLMAETLTVVKDSAPPLPTPCVHFLEEDPDGQGVGAPYILMDWLRGGRMAWTSTEPAISIRPKVLDQMARFTLHMILNTCRKTGPDSQTASQWILSRIDRRLSRILRGDLSSRGFDPLDCLYQRGLALEKYVVEDFETASFPMVHDDLNTSNILADEAYTITGIIDWDWPSYLPLQCAATFPAFIAQTSTTEPLSRIDDRRTFAEAFSLCVRDADLPKDRMDHLIRIIRDDELQLFQMSLKSIGFYEVWVECCREYSHPALKIVSRALESLLKNNPEFEDWKEISALKMRLNRMIVQSS